MKRNLKEWLCHTTLEELANTEYDGELQTHTHIYIYHHSDERKLELFQVVAISVLLYGCSTWTWMKHLEKRLHGNYTRLLHVVLNKSWKAHPIKLQQYSHLLPISLIILARQARNSRQSWRSKEKFLSDIPL